MWKILAIARVTLKESVRRKVFLGLLLFTALLIALAVSLPAIDPASRIRLVEGWCLRTISFFGVLIAVFLSATSIPDDIESKRVFLVVTRPITRLQVLAGKWLGFAGVLGLFLLGMGLLSVGYVRWLDGSLTGGPGKYLETRSRIEPVGFDFMHEKKSGGTASGTFAAAAAPLILLDQTTGARFHWSFAGLHEVPLGDNIRAELVVQAQSVDASYAGDGLIKVTREEAKEYKPYEKRLLWNVPSSFLIPSRLVSSKGSLDVFLEPANPRSGIAATPTSLVLYSQPIRFGFEWNFLKSLLTTFAQLLMITTLTLMGSTVVSGPVSIFLGLFFFLTGSMLEFVRGAMRTVEAAIRSQTERVAGGHDHTSPDDIPVYMLEYSRWVSGTVMELIPSLDRFDTPEMVLQGVVIPNAHVYELLVYAGTYTVFAFLLGWMFFSLRELK